VIQQVVPWGDAWTKTLAAIEAGTTPDFQFSLPELTITAYEANAIIPVDDIIQELEQKNHRGRGMNYSLPRRRSPSFQVRKETQYTE